MSGISSPGVGSGLDIKAIVDALVAADITPAKNRLDRTEAAYATELSAIGQIKGSLAKLQSSMKKLSDLEQFYTLKSTISNPDLFSATLGESATAGNYQIEVRQLATHQSLASTPFPSASTVLGNGSLTIAFGSYNNDSSVFTTNPDKQPLVINIAPGQDSLTAIRDAINNSGSDVHAAIVSDGQGARLTLTSGNSGKNYAMKITVSDNDGNNTDNSGLSALTYDPAGGNNNLQQTIAAQDSEIKVNGLTLTQSTNQYTDAIAGITLDLKKANLGEIVNLKITNDQGQMTALINEFVKQFNETRNILQAFSGYDKTSGKGGLFQSDAQIRGLKFALGQAISQPLKAAGGIINSLADLGIKTNSQGVLEIDNDKLNTAIQGNYDAIGKLFAKTDTDGLAVKINTIIEGYLGNDGSLTDRTDQLNKRLNEVGDQRAQLLFRTASLERRYLNQFSNLDRLLSSMQSTSNFLTQQLENLPQLTLRKK